MRNGVDSYEYYDDGTERNHDLTEGKIPFGDSPLLLDRYFLTVPALEKLRDLNGSGDVRMEIITKAKNPVPHMKSPAPENPGGDGHPKS